MEHEAAQAIKAAYSSLLEHSSLEVIIPSSRDVRAENVASSTGDELQRIGTRTHIFYDELTTVHVVLRAHTPQAKEFLRNLELTISAFITTAAPDGTNASAQPVKHEVAVQKLDASEFEQSAKVGTFHHTVWTCQLRISRPLSRRIVRPTIYFTATLGLSTVFLEHAKRSDKQFVPAFDAAPANVLESLQIGQTDTKFHLSEARITRVLPAIPQADDHVKVLRGASKQALTAGPALLPRIRGVQMPQKRLLALAIDAAPALTHTVELNSLEVTLSDGTTTELGSRQVKTLQGGDEISLLYELVPETRVEGTANAGRLTIQIKATVHMDDLDVALDIEREWHVDLRLPRTAVYHAWSGAPKVPVRPVIDDGEVIFDFTAPHTAVLGEEVELVVRCTNNSPRTRHFLLRVDAVDDDTGAPQSAVARTPDVRMDFVKAGECFEAVVRYVVMAAGVVDLGLVSIVDLDSKQSFEVHELPSVIAHV